MAIYGINEANKALYHNPMVKVLTNLAKAGGDSKVKGLCKRAYKSIDRAIQNDLNKFADLLNASYSNNGQLKYSVENGQLMFHKIK